MDLELVKKIIKIAEESNISGLAVEEGGFKVEVTRERAGNTQFIHTSAPIIQNTSSDSSSKEKSENQEADGILAITSPMVGTFYKKPSPDSVSFIEVGSRVEAGKVVCIVEAMKLFNEIESEISGTVTKILVNDGQSVEYGQKLILVKKD